MEPQEAIRELIDAGYSEKKIAEAIVESGVYCTQPTVHRIKSGEIADTGYALGKAILDFHAKATKPRGRHRAA